MHRKRHLNFGRGTFQKYQFFITLQKVQISKYHVLKWLKSEIPSLLNIKAAVRYACTSVGDGATIPHWCINENSALLKFGKEMLFNLCWYINASVSMLLGLVRNMSSPKYSNGDFGILYVFWLIQNGTFWAALYWLE